MAPVNVAPPRRETQPTLQSPHAAFAGVAAPVVELAPVGWPIAPSESPLFDRPFVVSPPADETIRVAPGGNRSTAYLAAKRAVDIVGALAALALFAPAMLTAYVVLTITTRGRAIFVQERIGQGGVKFRMLKFRTMRLDAEKLQHLVANQSNGPIFKNRRDPRVTRFGRFLRSFSIDEMPQLFNVLRGDMSLVGPRPLPTAEALKCRGTARRRYSVKPGLTCLWQVSGRSDIDFDGLVKRDLWYVRRQSLATDLKLLLRTPMTVLSRRGAY